MNALMKATGLALAMTLGSATALHAALIDPLDTADGFNDSFGGTTATANGDGTVTLTRTVAGVDAGINWTDNGFKVPIVTDEILRVTPSEAINGGYYSINVIFFDAAQQYLSEQVWITDTNSTDVQELTDIAALAGNPAADSFVLRFRVQPFAQANAAFSFDSIEVTTDTTLEGDLNGDGFVGVDDLNIILVNWNKGTPPDTGNGTIPEPASLALLGLGGLGLLRRHNA